ncbi:MAG: YbaB/EbfC family nucleoid-associated protein [Acidimicrobiales bacterium]|nr:YbaB/EbfC family nucleoid-associated protein [Acidimicrobiales bacterium]
MSEDNPLAGFDLNSLLETAQAMQSQMAEAQEAQAASVVTGSSGGGKVEIDVQGDGTFLAVRISPDVVDPDDVDLLSDLVLAALRDAAGQLAELQEQAMGGMDLGGMDLGGLGGMLGGG